MTSEAAIFAAEQADHRARQIRNGELRDDYGDMVERCIYYYAHALGITPEEIKKAMKSNK